mmetsp:Transcript_39510/g.66349  ORF Transcript_39510/g.66349 Transcript_39510/m.66349 type:complete len:595 (-) Transcript_39510:91-1875(-)
MEDYMERLSEIESLTAALVAARKKALLGQGSVQAVLDLRHQSGKVDGRFLASTFIHAVNEVAEGSTPVCVFIMSTTQQRDSGVDLVRRLHPASGLDLSRSWVFCDVMYGHVKGWKTMGAHVYSPEAARTLTLALMHVKNERNPTVSFFWRQIIKTSTEAEGGVEEVRFWGIMQDAAGALWIGFTTVFPDHPLERQKSCLFHFGENVKTVTAKLPGAFQRENKDLPHRWQQSASEEARLVNRNNLLSFWVVNVSSRLPELMSFFSFHERRQEHILDLNNPTPAGLSEMLQMPNSSYAETCHAVIKRSGGENKVLVDGVMFDINFMARQMVRAELRSAGTGGFGTGPRDFDLAERLMAKMQVRTERAVERDLSAELNDEAIAAAMGEDEPVDPQSGSDCEVLGDIRPSDTHRPDRRTKGVGRSTPTPIYKQVIQVLESEQLDETKWHLRRLAPGSQITCSSRGSGAGKSAKPKRCGAKLRPGNVFPSYRGERQYNPRGMEKSAENRASVVCRAPAFPRSLFPRRGGVCGRTLPVVVERGAVVVRVVVAPVGVAVMVRVAGSSRVGSSRGVVGVSLGVGSVSLRHFADVLIYDERCR